MKLLALINDKVRATICIFEEENSIAKGRLIVVESILERVRVDRT